MRDATWVPSYPDVQVMAAAILAAGWAPEIPVAVDTVDQLDALPVGSVIRHARTPTTHSTYARVTTTSYCWSAVGGPDRELSEQVLLRGPVQLLFVPQPGA